MEAKEQLFGTGMQETRRMSRRGGTTGGLWVSERIVRDKEQDPWEGKLGEIDGEKEEDGEGEPLGTSPNGFATDIDRERSDMEGS